MQPLRVLIIGAVWPEPTASAAGTRMMQLIRCFQHINSTIHFACVTETQQNAIDLKAQAINTSVIKPNDSTVDQQFIAFNPDIVMFDRFYIEEQFGWRISEHCPNAIKVLDTEDLHSLRNARHQLAKKHPNQFIAHSPEFLHTDIGLRELASIARCDIALMISEVEVQLLVERFPAVKDVLHYCPFMLEASEQSLPKPPLSFADRRDIVWIGNFLHEPNWDAVRFMRETLWPEIHKKLPDITLKIFGAYMPDKAKQLHSESLRFHVLGRADNAITEIQQAKLLLAPIRFGAGLKGKLIESMQCRTPSVCSEIAAEGITTQANWPGFVGHSIEELVHGTVHLYQNETAWEEASSKAEHILYQRFNAATHQTKLINKLIALKNHLKPMREHNILGALLNHHHQRSTKYMSRWIETKNRLIDLENKQ